MRPPIKYALQEQGVGHTSDTKESYGNILTHLFNFVKKRLNQISLFCTYYIQKRSKSSATIQFSQEICDPDGVVLHVTLAPPRVFIVDKDGSTVKFSPYMVPELRASLLEVEKKFGRRFSHE